MALILRKISEKTTWAGIVSAILQATTFKPPEGSYDLIVDVLWGIANIGLIIYSERKKV